METIKDVAEKGQGRIIFVDNGPGAANRMMQQLSGASGIDMEKDRAGELSNYDNVSNLEKANK